MRRKDVYMQNPRDARAGRKPRTNREPVFSDGMEKSLIVDFDVSERGGSKPGGSSAKSEKESKPSRRRTQESSDNYYPYWRPKNRPQLTLDMVASASENLLKKRQKVLQAREEALAAQQGGPPVA